MTSAELMKQAKQLKKIEKTIKLMERIRKDLGELERLDYEGFRTIIKDKSLFADELYYDVKDYTDMLKNIIK